MIFGDLFKNFFKYLFLTIMCLVPVVILFGGVYCGLILYKEKTSVSQNFGTLTERDLYEDFDVFDCDLSNATFYKTDSGYEYVTSIPKAVQFNGNAQKYNVLVNGQPSTNEQSTAGILVAKNTVNYYSIEGNVLQQTVLNIEFRFYQSRVQISIQNSNTAEQQALFLEYIQFNGLKLRTIEAQYVPTISTSEYYTITFLGKDGEVVASSKVAKGAIISIPTPPRVDGYEFDCWSPAVPKFATQNQTFTATYVQDTSFIRVILDNDVVENYSRDYVLEGIEMYDLTLNDVYPFLQVADNAGNYYEYRLNLSKDAIQRNYDIICTTKGDTISVSLGSITHNFVSGDITFVLELFVIDENCKFDSWIQEFVL